MTIPINTSSITSTSELIGTVFEEVSHLIDATAGRTKKTEETAVAGEQGLESLGRPVNEYFQEQYKKDDTPINLKDSGRDLTNANLGTKVGDATVVSLAFTIPGIGQAVLVGAVITVGGIAIYKATTSEEAKDILTG